MTMTMTTNMQPAYGPATISSTVTLDGGVELPVTMYGTLPNAITSIVVGDVDGIHARAEIDAFTLLHTAILFGGAISIKTMNGTTVMDNAQLNEFSYTSPYDQVISTLAHIVIKSQNCCPQSEEVV